MFIQTLFLKAMNNERKFFTHHKIIDRTVEKIVSLITPVCNF